MGLRDRLRKGLSRSREAISEIFYMGGEVDEDFWEGLEDRLVMGDMGGEVAMQVTDDLDREIKAAMDTERCQHVIKEADAGMDISFSAAVQFNGNENIGFFGFSGQRCVSHFFSSVSRISLSAAISL